MARLILTLLALLIVAGAIAALVRSSRPRGAIQRGVGWVGRVIESISIAAIGALLGGGLLYVGGTYVDDDFAIIIGVFGGLLMFPALLIRSLRSLVTPTTPPPRIAATETPNTPPAVAVSAALPTGRGWLRRGGGPLKQDPDQQLELVWDRALREADEVASEIAVARRSCRRFLDTVALDALDVDAIEWDAFIRKHVPNLVDSFAQRVSVRPDDRRAALENLADSLQRIGAEADRRVRAHLKTADAFDVVSEHIRRRTERDPFSPL